MHPTSASANARAKVAASIEAQAKQILDADLIVGQFPKGTRVYLVDLGIDTIERSCAAARRIKDAGCEPVPHIAARRLPSKAALDERLKSFCNEAGVRDILVIGGNPSRQEGEFASTLDVLHTGLADKYGIKEIGVAGHPEGSPDFSDDTAIKILKMKQAFGERTDARFRIVTQFGFDALKFIRWSEGLHGLGIDLPVHFGVAGPAKMTTIFKYALACGIGNSLDFLRKRVSAVAMLTARYSPEEIVQLVEQHVLAQPVSPIRQIHLFPFGGVRQTTDWLLARGSWVRGAAEAAVCD